MLAGNTSLLRNTPVQKSTTEEATIIALGYTAAFRGRDMPPVCAKRGIIGAHSVLFLKG
jgi:hypothetical protein